MRQNTGMTRSALLPSSSSVVLAFGAALASVLALAGCGTPPNEVVPQRDGSFRAPTYIQAADFCSKKGQALHQIGNGPAQTGVQFRCGD
jgi:hypothetical protein